MSDQPATPEEQARRIAAIEAALRAGRVPPATLERLNAVRTGRAPWVATLTPAELLSVRSLGLRPIAAITATCWMHYGWSWTQGHAQGWMTALSRLKAEARAAGANGRAGCEDAHDPAPDREQHGLHPDRDGRADGRSAAER